MTATSPIVMWFRRDLRLADHPALCAAAATGRPVVPVFIHGAAEAALGAAPKWRLGLALEHFAHRLAAQGSRLICRRGDALAVLRAVMQETGARTVYWSRLYDPDSKARDAAIKSALKDAGAEARSFPGHVLFEPWTVETGAGGYYKVYSPFWRAVKDRAVMAPLAPPGMRAPDDWPVSDTIADWHMAAAMNRGADVVAPYVAVGEGAAQDRLAAFLDDRIAGYGTARDYPARNATSHLSENLAWGEIAPAAIWHAAQRAHHDGAAGAGSFLKELVWRDFAWHLLHHSPRIATRNWREGWDDFPWNEDAARPEVLAWQQGRTGIAFVDAAMRELYVTGTMHNRARMIVASYLTRHLMTHWRIGQAWFADCLVDWDPASNAMGWQWVAGSGPDAAPYFRIFNPDTQAENFDKDGVYRSTWIAEGRKRPTETALSYFQAVPRSWGLDPAAPYPPPVVALDAGRARALAAYAQRTG